MRYKGKMFKIPKPRPQTVAKFDGGCEVCGARVFAGDTIYKIEDVWVCEDCCEDYDEAEKRLG